MLFMVLTLSVGNHASARVGGESWRAEQIFSKQSDELEEQLHAMSLADKVGQMIIADIEPTAFSPRNKKVLLLSRLAQEGKIGGVIFMKGDAKSTGAVVNHLQALAPLPLLFSSDMERGVAMRISGTTEFPPNMALGATADPKLAEDMATAIAQEATLLGMHHNYAPTVDLNSNPRNPVINTRAFGDTIPLTIVMANAIIKGLQSHGVLATAKHFPGHGNVTVDSHVALPVLQATREQLEAYELIPFRAAIEQGVATIMVGHLAVPALTGNMEPATISPAIVTTLLRQELGFKGLIITDALNMKALYNGSNVATLSVRAVQAGNDLLLFSPDPEATHSAVVQAVEAGQIPLEQINASVRRILQAKQWLKLEKHREVDSEDIEEDANPASHRELARKIAEHAVTLVSDVERNVPLKKSEQLLHLIVQDRVNYQTGRNYLRQLSERYPTITHLRINPKSDALDYAIATELAMNASSVLVTSYVQSLSSNGELKLTAEQQNFLHLLPTVVQRGTPMVLLSLGTPYISNYFPEFTSYLCTYSFDEESERAALQVLQGELTPRGVLPIVLGQ